MLGLDAGLSLPKLGPMAPRVQDFRIADYARAAGAQGTLLPHRALGSVDLHALYLERAWLDVERWFPITNDAATMYDAFGVFHPAKTRHLYTHEMFAALAGRAEELSAEAEYERAFALGSFPNYWHTLVDFIPRLAFCFASGEVDLPLLVGPSLPVQQEILRVVYAARGLSAPRVIALPPEIVAVRRAIFPFRPSLEAAIAFWQMTLPVDETIEPRDLLFVRRGAVGRRRLINEDEVAARLVSRGFVCVEPGSMSFLKQVQLFSAARVVVGAHGAGLTNILFSPPKGVLVELLAGLEQPFFKSTAAALGWRRVVVRDDGVPTDASHHLDFVIDLGALDRALDIALTA